MTTLAPPARVRVPDPGPPTRVQVPDPGPAPRVRLPAVDAVARVRAPSPGLPHRVRLPAVDAPTRVQAPSQGPPTTVRLPRPDLPTRVRPPRAGRAPMADLQVPEGADDRGTVSVDDRVVEKVAGYAVLKVPGAAAPPTRVLGVNVGEADADGEAKVRARVDGGTAVVEATIAVGWPASVRSVVERVRESVVREVGEIVDVRVDHVDVDVVSLTVPTARSRRRLG